MSTVARNDACPCGSGRKVKKCHEQLVGVDLAVVVEARRINAAGDAYVAEHLAFFAACEGYQPPPAGDDGWERANWQAVGCPFSCGDHDGPACNKGTEDTGRCASLSCGV